MLQFRNARGGELTPKSAALSKSTAIGGVRGSCQLCGKDVYDTQPRFKDPNSGLYQHQDCQPTSKAESEAMLAQAEADSRQTKGAAAANSADIDDATFTPAVISAATATSPSTAGSTPKPLLPVAPKTKPLLPGGKHAFLSYQWDVQEQVKAIKGMLNEKQIKCTDATIF